MIPANFGLAIGNSAPVGHAVGHNRMCGRTAFRVSAGRSEQGSGYLVSKAIRSSRRGQSGAAC
jgi:hypothetical protein